MDSRTMINIYKWASYILIAGATAVFFLTKKTDLTLVLLTMAVFMYALMFRTRARALEEENNQLSEDLRKLTLALAKAKGEQKTTDNDNK